jgi:prolipoprotein diacylglyceryltransferase
LSYGTGRIGCQVAGDGDWGIVNTSPKPFGWLPDWMWAYNYPNNVNEAGVPIPGCAGKYCNELNPPVYPTPLYEIVVCLLLFALLWSIRKKLKTPGRLFALYLMLNGIERFFIEKIRVNTRLNIFGFQPTQAEVISTLLFLTGLIMWIFLKRRQTQAKSTI